MRRLFMILLLLSFLVLLISTLGLFFHIQPRRTIKEIHEISGGIFILLTCIHVYFHRNVVKAMLKRK